MWRREAGGTQYDRTGSGVAVPTPSSSYSREEQTVHEDEGRTHRQTVSEQETRTYSSAGEGGSLRRTSTETRRQIVSYTHHGDDLPAPQQQQQQQREKLTNLFSDRVEYRADCCCRCTDVAWSVNECVSA